MMLVQWLQNNCTCNWDAYECSLKHGSVEWTEFHCNISKPFLVCIWQHQFIRCAATALFYKAKSHVKPQSNCVGVFQSCSVGQFHTWCFPELWRSATGRAVRCWCIRPHVLMSPVSEAKLRDGQQMKGCFALKGPCKVKTSDEKLWNEPPGSELGSQSIFV